MPVGKGSIERAVKAKKVATKTVEPKQEEAAKPKTSRAKKTVVVQEAVIAATSSEVMEMVTGKRPEKAVRVGDQMPDYLL